MLTETTNDLMEENEMPTNRSEEALIEAIKIINEEVRNPDKLNKHLTRIQETLEKGVTSQPEKPADNA